ncbi:MAG: alpha/beta fold hydrolase [Xanthomonadales bacterium]|nr:alpha/beta fold hydrolase [Xanthomonadales bacterium]
MQTAELTIPARDGFQLAATHFQPAASGGRLVLINSAMATPRHFYRHFAAALADAGFSVITWDYRGINDSGPSNLRGFEARMRDWVLLDMAGVVDWIGHAHGPERLFLVGHSAGGQLAGLLDNPDRVHGMVTASAQSGHWRLQGGGQKWTVLLHVYLSLPLLSHLFGYLPWSRFMGGEDIPKGVALEWARWCRDRDYILGDPTLPQARYSRFTAPVLAYSIDDDNWGTARSVDAVMRAYPHVERRHLVPGQYAMKSIGHFGFFKKGSEALWQEAMDWLNRLS